MLRSIARRRVLSSVLAFFCTLGLVGSLSGQPAIAQKVSRATITQVLDGSDVFIQDRKAKVQQSANKGQRVRTGATRTELAFDTGAVGRLAHNSSLTVGQCARLKKGTLLINGAMNGCSGSAVAGVRGTTYVMEVDDAGITRVSVLEGHVTVSPADPKQPIDPDEAAEPAPAATPPATPPATSGAPTPGKAPNQAPSKVLGKAPGKASQAQELDKTKQFRLPVSLPLPGQSAPDPQPSPPAPADQPAKDTPLLIDETKPTPPANGATPNAVPAGPDPDGSVTVASGEAVAVAPTGKVGSVFKLSEADYRRILTGALFDGYTVQIPGIDKVRQAYSNLFPGLPFPISIPSLNIAPPIRIRLPF